MSEEGLSRRSVLNGCGLCVVGGILGFAVANNSDAAKPKDPHAQANAYGDTPDTGNKPLAAVDQVPAGGGLILKDAKLVLTKSSAGEVHAFSITCPHQGCPVGSVEGGVIVCPCHGSTFALDTGARVSGPATSGLTAVAVTVQGDHILGS
jgi:nitrite reductase/ring-hydroxylating ferredoxin subunit